MRAAQNLLTPLVDKQSKLLNSQATDVKSSFVTTASLHLINIKSVTDLKEKIAQKYTERTSENGETVTLNDFDYELFRPNIVIDYDTPYVEEEIMQARIGNILLRQVGPAWRCKVTAIDWKTGDLSEVMEPYKSIHEDRNLKGIGGIFGIYMQLDIMAQDFFGFHFEQERLENP